MFSTWYTPVCGGLDLQLDTEIFALVIPHCEQPMEIGVSLSHTLALSPMPLYWSPRAVVKYAAGQEYLRVSTVQLGKLW